MKDTLFKQVARFQYSSEAAVFKGKLESSGISVFLHDNHTIDSDPLLSNAIGGVKLFVRSHDYIKASDILSEISEFSIDDEGTLLQCPACGAEQIELVTSVRDPKAFFSFISTALLSLAFVLSVLPFYAKYKYKCSSCSHEFTK